jgi:hypothetical protein
MPKVAGKILWVSWGKVVESVRGACGQTSSFVHIRSNHGVAMGINRRLFRVVYTFCIQLLPQPVGVFTSVNLLFSPSSTGLITTTTKYINIIEGE